MRLPRFAAGLLAFSLVHCLQSPLSTYKSLSTSKSPFLRPAVNVTASWPNYNLAGVSSDEFTTLSHAAFPGFGVRVKRASDFCDPTVKAYTGYLDIDYGAKHLFFYFFESRRNSQNDDLMMWINGGPGASSALGLFMELGPCLIDAENTGKNGTVFNPFGWNDKANVFFLDQPVGVGFSYAEYGQTIETTEDAAKNIAAFMYVFCNSFSEFQGRPFHMAGESYGGRYIPVFAAEIVDHNKRATAGGFIPVNLKSIMIGNGATDFETETLSYYDMTCTNASVEPILDISTCVRMKRVLPRCQKMMQDECITRFDELGCTAAIGFCYTELMDPFMATGRNPYDISKICEDPDSLCYPITGRIVEYLNRPEIRSQLGVDAAVANFTSGSASVGIAFARHMDEFHPTPYYIAGLLERGVDTLIYAGDLDWICNWVGNSRWVETLEWHGQAGFNKAKYRDWTVDGHAAGITKGYKGLTFATIYKAGHMVPYDKPAEALAMVNRWLEERRL